jgi:octaprenyl-diphosphate synthase
MDSLKLIRQPIEEDMGRYKIVFDSHLSHSNTLLNEVLGFVGERKGKMMRPILAMLAARLFGDIDDKVINTAATFEFFHTASLIHDDIVDESELRRGQASVNGVYDNKMAVLVGDFILACALKCACAAGDVRLVEVVSDAAQRLANGELLQLQSVSNRNISEDIYFDIIKEYGEVPISIMQAALIATAEVLIYGRAPTENYAFKAILKPYKKGKQ